MTAILTTRNATLADMVAILRHQRARRLDVVAPATAIHAHEGNLVISATVQQVTDDGVTSAAGIYRPTQVADEGISAKLGINLAYLRRLREQRPDLWDANVNGWLHGNDLGGIEPDGRKFLVRLFQAEGDNLGVARAVLSDSYKVIDTLDALMATLDGIRQAGTEVEFDGLDLTERRLYARVVAPQIQAYAPALLAGYRSPFGGEIYVPGRNWTPEQARQAAAREGRGYEPGAEPVLFAGFVISNSEVGEGAWSITPRIVAEICGNGLQIVADVARAVHPGSRHDEGVIRYTADTQEKELALITARARDAVATFLSPDYLLAKVTEIERKAGVPVSHPEETVRHVAKAAKFSDELADPILAHFIRGGQLTAGGVMQAVTSVAQTLDDADTACDLETQALRVMDLVAQF
ncbi:MAG TPA: DUF932 domain-containing protein [Streptosporangiaceae bacterium]|nr:DUF932 domain-containing protein [Streptosporangiaceae bacterium]